MHRILAVRDDTARDLLTFSYYVDTDGRRLLSSVTDVVSGRTITYTPGADGPAAVSRINAPSTARWTYAYEGGFLSRIAQPSAEGTGEVWTDISYADGKVAQTSDSAGHVRRYTYAHDHPVAETGCTVHGTLVELLDSSVGAVLHSYVEKVDATTGFTRGRYENGRESVVEYCADQEGYSGPNRTKPWRVTDFAGRVTEYGWDDHGGLAAVSRPSTVGTTITTVSRTWGAEGYPHPAGCQIQTGTQTPTILAYESARGLLTNIQSPVPGAATGAPQWVSTSLTYDSTTGDLRTFTRPAPATTGTVTVTLEYTDATHPTPMKGRPLTVRVPYQGSSAYVTRFAWNTDGTLQSVTDPANHTTEYTYGLTHQPATVRFPATGENGAGRAQVRYGYGFLGGPLTSLRLYDEAATYDVNGNPLSSPLAQTLYAYDENGRIVSRQGDTEPAFARYDALGRLAWLADGHGFNPTDPENSVRTGYTYESTDSLAQVQVTFAGGESPYARHVPENDPCDFAVEYSPLLSLFTGTGMLNLGFAGPNAELTDKEVTGQSGLNVHLVYDPYGRVTETWHGAGDPNYDAYTTFVDKEVRSYDDLDNVTSIQFSYAGLPSRTISYTYFPDGHRKTMAVSGLGTFSYTYNLAGQVKTITNPYSQVFSYGYNGEGLLTSQSSAFVSKSYTYNAREQLKTIHNQNTSGSQPMIFSDFAVTHDGAGNIKTLGASHFGWVIPPPGAMVPMALLPSYNEGTTTYTYSPSVGEQNTGYGPLRREHTTRFNSPADAVHAYDAAFNPVTFRGAGPLAYNANNQSTGITYDDAGNPATRGAASLTFNIDNQLTAYNGTAVTCGYRADGLRAWKQVGATRTYYLYDGTAPLCEMNSAGSITAVTTFGANGLLSRRVGAADTHYAFDPSGNVANYVTSPVTASHTGFDAYGQRFGTAYTDPFGYQAQWGAYTDRSSASDSGLVLMGYRYYDPTTGRFLNRDPIGYAGGLNLYAYCRNNPVNLIDPLGLCGEGGLEVDGTDDDPIIRGQVDGTRDWMRRAKKVAPIAWDAINSIYGYIDATGGLIAGCISRAVAGGGDDLASALRAATKGRTPEMLECNQVAADLFDTIAARGGNPQMLQVTFTRKVVVLNNQVASTNGNHYITVWQGNVYSVECPTGMAWQDWLSFAGAGPGTRFDWVARGSL
jgi:RHS repeat-associated protein